MSERTPERLQAFRDEHAPKNAWAKNVIAALVLGVMLGTAGSVAAIYFTASAPGAGSGKESASRARELALLYENKDMPDAAIEAYTQYLELADLADERRADVVYSIAKLAIGAGDFERALAFLYQAEHLDPDSMVRDERGGHIVHCLEQLGRTSSLRRELKNRTAPKSDAARDSSAIVLAEFGNETVTDRDLERKLDEMPESVRGSYSAPEKRTELLKNLVAERLLLDKAFRLKLDEDEELQARMKAMRDSLLVRKLMEDEVRDNVTVTPADVERFYKAEVDRFTQPASARVLVANAETEDEAAAITEFSGQPIAVREGERLGGLPNSPEVIQSIFDAKLDVITDPIGINDRYYVFKIVSKTPERVAAFEEVKMRAEQMLRAEKEQEHVVLLVEETLRARNVKLYPERLEAKPAP